MLNRDWIHGETTPIIEIEMSMAQFGALVSSFGDGSGVPVTLRYANGKQVQKPPYAPRTAESLREVEEATDRVFDRVADSVASLRKAFNQKAGRVEMADQLRKVEWSVESAKPTTRFIAKSFTEHVENVVTKARADIEATAQMAAARGIESGEDIKRLLPG